MGRGGPDGDHRWGLCPRYTLLAVGDEDVGIADGAAVNCKWDGIGCAGMARCSPEIWPIDPRPPQIL